MFKFIFNYLNWFVILEESPLPGTGVFIMGLLLGGRRMVLWGRDFALRRFPEINIAFLRLMRYSVIEFFL